jgi:hypothetical protein
MSKDKKIEYKLRIKICPVCDEPDGLDKDEIGIFYMCGRPEKPCESCKTKGFDYISGHGPPPRLRYKGIELDITTMNRPYIINVRDKYILNSEKYSSETICLLTKPEQNNFFE